MLLFCLLEIVVLNGWLLVLLSTIMTSFRHNNMKKVPAFLSSMSNAVSQLFYNILLIPFYTNLLDVGRALFYLHRQSKPVHRWNPNFSYLNARFLISNRALYMYFNRVKWVVAHITCITSFYSLNISIL